MGNYQRQRNAFVSVWLWLSVVCSAILLAVLLLGLYRIMTLAGSLPTEILIELVTPCFLALCTLVGYIQLLCWKRKGFTMLVSVTLIYILLNVLAANEAKLELSNIGVEVEVNYLIVVVAPLVSMLILFLILQIRKNGVSYWKAMALDASKLPYSSDPAHGHYCPQCGCRSLETAKFCTECGAVLKPSTPPMPPVTPAPVHQATDIAAVEASVTDDAEVCPETAVETSFKRKNRLGVWLILLSFIIFAGVAILFTSTSDDSESPEDYYSLAEFEGDLTSEVVTEGPSVEEYPTTGFHYGYEWVDLGLSSGLKWATYNVGASSPEGFGSHFAWGEVESVESGNPKARLNGELYEGDEETLDISGSWAYDAARVNWGGYWRMPSSDECDELIKECIWRWKTKNGVEGYEVTGSNGNSIFLPAADERAGYGYYWSSSGSGNPFAADYIAFGNDFLEISPWGSRDGEMTIRPVYSADNSHEESIPASDTFYRKGVLSVNGVIYPMAYVEGEGVDFYIGKYEVTQALWKAVMGTDVIEQRNKANPKWSLRGVGDNYPMYYVNYYEAVEFCNKLEQLTGRNFFLPNESQWEYAAKGGQYDFGNYGGGAWYKDNSDATTHEVGGKDSNQIGLYDMCGNVREWCDGWDGSKRVLRGGGWYNGEDEVTVTSRYSDDPEVRDNNYGFRICLEL